MIENNSDIIVVELGNGVKMWVSRKEYEVVSQFFDHPKVQYKLEDYEFKTINLKELKDRNNEDSN